MGLLKSEALSTVKKLKGSILNENKQPWVVHLMVGRSIELSSFIFHYTNLSKTQKCIYIIYMYIRNIVIYSKTKFETYRPMYLSVANIFAYI